MVQRSVDVFVYGTLKKGFHNNHLMTGCRFISEKELKGYSMKSVEGSFPCITKEEGHSVFGELWSVPVDVLAYNLDLLENYNPYRIKNVYERIKVKIDDKLCFTYVWSNEKELELFEEVKGGIWV